jgi:hypothetical protein
MNNNTSQGIGAYQNTMDGGARPEVVDSLNASPENIIFGMETKMNQLMLDAEDAQKNNNPALYQSIVTEINDIQAKQIELKNSLADTSIEPTELDALDMSENDLIKINESNEDLKNKSEEKEFDFEKAGEFLNTIGSAFDFKNINTGAKFINQRGTKRIPVPSLQRYQAGGIASMMPMGMDDGGFATGFGFNNSFLDGFEDVYMTDEEREQYEEEVRRYNEAQNDPDAYNESVNPTISFGDALSRGYGAPQADRIAQGIDPSKLNYADTEPGLDISIDARDETPAAYKFYPSEVSKLYSQMKGVPFSPLVAPPKEATFVDELGLYDESGNVTPQRRIQSQLYAKDGTYVNAYADGTGRYGAQQLEPSQFPRRQELITGPGGERGDKIPAMLSDGEFVTNSAAVRGMGIMAGANPEDEYEQRLLGARQMYDYQKQAEEMAKRYT